MVKKRASVKGLGKAIFTEKANDQHPIDTFTADDKSATIMNIPLDKIIPNPDQPRKHFSESGLNELADSIRSKGLLQPIIVAKQDNGYLLVAGERRYRASKIAGLNKIPCIIKSDDPLELAIIENLQREDLKPIEEAEGLQALADKFEYSHEKLAQIVGKSRTTVTEILSLNRLPKPIKDECRTSDIGHKSLLFHVVRQPDEPSMLAVWDKIKNGQLTVKAARKLKLKHGSEGSRERSFTHTFRAPNKSYSVTVRFRKTKATEDEIVNVLEEAIKEIRNKSNTENNKEND